MIDDLNGFSRLIRITGRSWEDMHRRMIQDVRVPATVVQFGESTSGMNWVVLKLSALEKPSSKANPRKELPIPPSEKTETVKI